MFSETSQLFFTALPGSYHGPIIRTVITCEKISCYMSDSAFRWLIVENPRIFQSYVKYF